MSKRINRGYLRLTKVLFFSLCLHWKMQPMLVLMS